MSPRPSPVLFKPGYPPDLSLHPARIDPTLIRGMVNCCGWEMWSRDVFPDAVCEFHSVNDVCDQRVAGEPAPSLAC
jgi:hypothetical protein